MIKPVNKILLIAVVISAITAGVLFLNGRMPWGAAAGPCLWFGAASGHLTSQCLLDPYTFTHILHGFGFYFLLWLLARKFSLGSRLLAAITLEGLWEILENTSFIIDRYRAANIELNYYGDSIFNSLGDILAMAVGFLAAAALPALVGVIVFVGLELFLLFWIRDSLTLQIVVLFYPFEFIRDWQNGI
jgi:hypothetical protein